MQQHAPPTEPGELAQASAWLIQEGIAATPRVLAALAKMPDIESNEPAQAVLADVIAVLLDGCERGELAAVVAVFADCPPVLAEMALALLTAAFFPDGKIVPAEFDDSAILCFSLFVAVAGKPSEALDLIDLTLKERKGERFTANAALLRAHIEKSQAGDLQHSQPQRTITDAERNAIVLQVQQQEARRREAAVNKPPKVRLAEKHMRNCTLLLDRARLLAELPHGGVVAELGVDHGDFSARILESTRPTRLHLVDMWGSERDHGGLFEGVKERFSAEIAEGRVKVHRKMSVEAADDFADACFDWIYIDTDHSYETTARELRRFAPKVKEGGLIAGHDYCMGKWANGYRYGVIEAVHEFCVKENWELVYLTADPLESQSFAIRRLGQGDSDRDGNRKSATPAAAPRALVFMTARNCERYVGDSLRSLARQTHDNMHVLFVDDASDDATGSIASGLLTKLFPGRHSFIRNGSQWGKARNAHVHLRSHAPDATFIAILDGDDQLIAPDILARIAAQYARGMDVVWTNYVTDQNKAGHCGPLDPLRSPRVQGWKTSHFFTFRAELLGNVSEDYFRNEDGDWFTSACDWAIAYPILDQTRRYHHIPESAYRYISGNPHSHHNSDPDNPLAGKLTSALQKKHAQQVLNKPPLPCLRDRQQDTFRPTQPEDVRPTASQLVELEQAKAWLMQDGVAATQRVLAVLAGMPDIESSESAQAVLADLIAVLLEQCEKGRLADVIAVFADTPPALAKMALALLTAAFFPDGRIIPDEFDDSAILCFSLFVAVAGKPFEALDLIDLAAKERKGERFATNAALLRMHIESKAGSSLPLSVIVPSYKGDDWILDGLDSLAEQSLPWSKYEVIVVVNGPRTHTPELIQEWLSRHLGFPLKAIVTEKAGAAYARNIGLDAAQGEYVVFMDDDDRAGHSMLEALLRHAAPDVVSMVPVGFVHDAAWETPDHDNWVNRQILPRLGTLTEWHQIGSAVALTAGKAWYRERALRVRFDEEVMSVGEDRVFNLGYVAQGPCALRPVSMDNDSAYLWGIREGSLSIRAVHMKDWDQHVEPWLKVAGALAKVASSTKQAATLRNSMVGDVVHTFIGRYLKKHPEDEQRVVDALTARGIKVE
jgi:glycosyltransferase involved in cell wall biosynthesis